MSRPATAEIAETRATTPPARTVSTAGATQPRLRDTFAQIVPASLLVQALSFGSSIVLATQLGASTMTDAYYLALSVPVVAYTVLLAGLRLGGIPALTAIGRGDSGVSLGRASSEVLTATIVAATAISCVLTAITVVFLPLAAGASHHLSSLTRLYLIELAPYAVTGAALGAMGAVLAVRGKFAIATLVLAVEPVTKSVLVLLFGHHIGAQALVLGNIVGNAIAVALLWAAVRRTGVRITLVDPRSSEAVRRVLKVSAPLVISQAVLQLNPLIDRTMAASLGGGSVTVMELGLRLFSVPAALLTGTMIAPLAAAWSSSFLERGWSAVVDSFGRVVAMVALVAPVLVTIGIVARHDLVAFAYSSQAYTPHDVSQTASVLGMLLLGLIPQILVVPLATLFVIRGDAVFPMKVGIANCAINAVLDLVLRVPLGVAGIALSTSITYTTLCVIYVVTAIRRWGSLNLWRSARKPLTASLVSSLLITALALTVGGGVHPSTRIAYLEALLGIAAVGGVIHFAVVGIAHRWLGLDSGSFGRRAPGRLMKGLGLLRAAR